MCCDLSNGVACVHSHPSRLAMLYLHQSGMCFNLSMTSLVFIPTLRYVLQSINDVACVHSHAFGLAKLYLHQSGMSFNPTMTYVLQSINDVACVHSHAFGLAKLYLHQSGMCFDPSMTSLVCIPICLGLLCCILPVSCPMVNAPGIPTLLYSSSIQRSRINPRHNPGQIKGI
ncbi:hypothetical protein J6590_001096 [Homalodisca vitripennis]|nr:hypothetical protein J6590_001096 [Homalodisca vitripennis]